MFIVLYIFFFERDIKAANILWDSNGNIRLGDLGEACENESGILQYDLVGTPFFMAPEVCSGEVIIYKKKKNKKMLGILYSS